MYAGTYTHILPYFQYKCKLFEFKISQKIKRHFEKVGNFQTVWFCIFFTYGYIYLIAILYYCILVQFILNYRRFYIYIIIIRVSLKNENKHWLLTQYSMKTKEQTRKLDAGYSKQCFEVADESWCGLKRFSKSTK